MLQWTSQDSQNSNCSTLKGEIRMRAHADQTNQEHVTDDVPIQWLYEEELRDKHRLAKQHKMSYNRKGKGKARLGTYDYLNREQRRALRESGKVKVWNMNEILDYEQFRVKPEDEQRRLLTHWRDKYKNDEIVKGMNLSDYKALHRIVDRLKVPLKRQPPKTAVNNPPISQEMFEEVKQNGVDYDTFIQINVEQRNRILYYWFHECEFKAKDVIELLKEDEDSRDKVYAQKYQMQKWARKKGLIRDPKKEMEEQQKAIQERLEEQNRRLKAQEPEANKMQTPSENKATRSISDLREIREKEAEQKGAEHHALNQRIKELERKLELSNRDAGAEGYEVSFSGTYTGDHIARRLEHIITILKSERSEFSLDLEIKEIKTDDTQPMYDSKREKINQLVSELLGG